MASIRPLIANLNFASDPAECGWPRPPVLMNAIERQVLPQLLRLHPKTRSAAAIATRSETIAIAAQAAGADPTALTATLDRLLATGATGEALCLDVLAPAACHLGVLWEEDELDFVQVTIGMQRLQHALRTLAPSRSRIPRGAAGPQRRILVIPVPGNQHNFGISMVARFFRNAGWDVRSDVSPTLHDLARLLRETHFDVVGISASCDKHMEPLSRALRTVRQSSCNAEICTMVGGPLFALHPELAVQLGADSTAKDAAQAPLQAELLLRERQDAHKPAGFFGGTNLWVVTPGERGGSDKRDTFRDGRNDARRPRSHLGASNHLGGG